jgi:hypothetical protein
MKEEEDEEEDAPMIVDDWTTSLLRPCACSRD